MKDVSHTALGLVLLMVGWAATAFAQTPGSCPRSLGEAYLDVGNVRARIFNTGGLFYQGAPSVYEVPKGDGAHALYAVSIGIVGRMGNTIRAAATRYGEWEFWAGPLDEHANPPDDCVRYDQLWTLSRDDLIAYNETGIAPENLRDWPWRLGAPVVDGDGIDGNYDLEEGDRPALIGDQMIWWVMNDVGNEHRSTGSLPIGMEVHGTAFAFHRPHSYIDNVTFYRFHLINKNREPFENAFFGLYVDVDLGNFDDDYVGSDSLLHLGFAYNSDNYDEGSRGYGISPPAVGLTFLRTADAPDGRDNDHDGQVDEPGEQQGMTAFPCTHKNWPSWPNDARQYHNCMRGLWPDGKPIVAWGNGRPGNGVPTDEITTYIYSGDPVTGQGWSEMNPATDGSKPAVDPADRRFYMASGPFTLQPGQAQEILFAIVWARGRDHLDSVRELKKVTARLHEVADEIFQVALPPQLAPPPEPTYGLGFGQNFPNPFSASTTIRYSLPQAIRVRLKVFDVLGREVATLVDAQQDGGLYEVSFEAGELPDGVYFYRLQLDYWVFTRKMVLMR